MLHTALKAVEHVIHVYEQRAQESPVVIEHQAATAMRTCLGTTAQVELGTCAGGLEDLHTSNCHQNVHLSHTWSVVASTDLFPWRHADNAIKWQGSSPRAAFQTVLNSSRTTLMASVEYDEQWPLPNPTSWS
jgi:hypothetical protein